jgi:hypothetical protein
MCEQNGYNDTCVSRMNRSIVAAEFGRCGGGGWFGVSLDLGLDFRVCELETGLAFELVKFLKFRNQV